MCSCSSRRYGSVSLRNASSSPPRARARVWSVTSASSHCHFLSSASRVMTSGRLEIRRSVFLAADASTNANKQQPHERRAAMGRIVISENVSLDGVVQDPAGDEGFRHGGWVGRITDHPEVGKLAFDEALGAGAFLLGRRSYDWFAAKWPSRTGALADRMNSMPKYVVSSTLEDPDWNNSTMLKGDVLNEVAKLKQEID